MEYFNENPRTILNGAYEFQSFRCEHSMSRSRIVCVLNTLGFYCVTTTNSNLKYSKITGFLAVKRENDPRVYIALMM